MKKVFSILLALGLVLTMGVMSAVPAAAVTPGTITVKVSNPLAGELSDYDICFHNGSNLLLADGDYIDIMFPAGTDITTVTAVTTSTSTSCGGTLTLNTAAFILVGTTAIRIHVAADILKCTYVIIEIVDVTNPTSCYHHLQVGSSTHTPSASNDYAIYTAEIFLVPGKNLIALPAYPADTSIEVVLADLFARAAADPDFSFSVWYWDSWDQVWLKYMSDSSQSDLTVMEAGKAYWIKVSHSISFLFKGDPYPYCQGPPQKWCYPPSWSMIGITGTAALWASDYLSDAMLPWPQHNMYAVSTIFGFTAPAFVDTGWNPGDATNLPTAWMTLPAPPNVWPQKSDALLQPAVGYFMSFLDYACIIPPP